MLWVYDAVYNDIDKAEEHQLWNLNWAIFLIRSMSLGNVIFIHYHGGAGAGGGVL